jgi:hypothetical protein
MGPSSILGGGVNPPQGAGPLVCAWRSPRTVSIPLRSGLWEMQYGEP